MCTQHRFKASPDSGKIKMQHLHVMVGISPTVKIADSLVVVLRCNIDRTYCQLRHVSTCLLYAMSCFVSRVEGENYH